MQTRLLVEVGITASRVSTILFFPRHFGSSNNRGEKSRGRKWVNEKWRRIGKGRERENERTAIELSSSRNILIWKLRESLNCKSRDQWTWEGICSSITSLAARLVHEYPTCHVARCMFCGLFKRLLLLFVSHNDNRWMMWKEESGVGENEWMESRKEEAEKK